MITKNVKPADILPFKLYDISDYIVEEHPIFHPLFEQDLYTDYWEDQIDSCIRGKWGFDYDAEKFEGGYRWMPGNLYFYINMTSIKIEEAEGRESESKPLLRDVEWLIFYALAECDGFSGFEDDENYTCYLPIGKMQGKVFDDKGKKITEITNKDKIRIERYEDKLKKKNGEYKEYIDVKDYLYKVYEKPIGRPLFYNEMKNLIVLSSRGVGKSYSISNGVVQYDFTFGSSRTVDEFLNRSNPSTIVVGSALSNKSGELLDKFVTSYEYTRKTVGAYPSENINSPLYQVYEGSLKSGSFISNRTKEEGGKSFQGTGSKIAHVSYRDNPSAAVGHRARRVIVEEAGLLDNFEEVHGENSAVQRRETKIGYTVYIGTGGNIEKIKGIREAFYNPTSYECASFKDNFSNKPNNIGLFIPSYFRSADYKDKQGNTDILKAFEDEMFLREQKRKSGLKVYEGHIISYPIVPGEMFLQSSTNPFPTDLLENRLVDLETGEWERIAKPGKLDYFDKEKTKVFWTPVGINDVKIIKRWGDEKQLTDEEKKGCIVVYEPPLLYKPDLTFYNYLYVVTYDSINDEDGGSSIAVVHVWKFWDFDNPDNIQHNLVAEWYGRHIGTNGLEKDHEVAFKLAAYYSAPLFPEINLKDILRYARVTKRYNWLLAKPKIVLDGMNVNQAKSYDVGMFISPGMKPDLETYLAEALHEIVRIKHTIKGNKEEYEEIKMATELPSMRLCEELLYYDRASNFDAVSSAFLFGVIRRLRNTITNSDQNEDVVEKMNYEDFIKKVEERKANVYNPAFDY